MQAIQDAVVLVNAQFEVFILNLSVAK